MAYRDRPTRRRVHRLPCRTGSRPSPRVRDLVHDADPEVHETIKRTIRPYFVLEGNISALLADQGPCQRLPLRRRDRPRPGRGRDRRPRQLTARRSRIRPGRGNQRARAPASCSGRSSRTTAQAAGASSRPVGSSNPDQDAVRGIRTPTRSPEPPRRSNSANASVMSGNPCTAAAIGRSLAARSRVPPRARTPAGRTGQVQVRRRARSGWPSTAPAMAARAVSANICIPGISLPNVM